MLNPRRYPQSALEQSRGTCGYLLMQYHCKALSNGGAALLNKAGMQDHAKHPGFALSSVLFQFKGLERRAVISPTSGCLVMQWGPASVLDLENLGCRCVGFGFGTGEYIKF